MVEIARQGFTRQQIVDALHGRTGSQTVKFRYDVMRGGAKLQEIYATGSVALNRFSEIQRTANFTIYQELDWLKDEIKPYMLLKMDDAQTSGALYTMPCAVFDGLNLTADEFDALMITGDNLDRGFVKTLSSGTVVKAWEDRDALDWDFGKWDASDVMWETLDSGKITKPEYIEFPLGVFILSSPVRHSYDNLTSYEVAAYDRTVILREDSVIEPLFIAAGTPYLDAVQSILVGAGISNVLIADTIDTVLPTDREFEVGTKKLSIINTLLGEINFNTIRCNADGQFVISRYYEPSVRRVSYTYKADELSVISRDTTSELDLYNVPNVFIAVCSNPELAQDYRAVWINDKPASKLSTVSRGRNITSEIYQPDVISSQDALDAYIRRIAWNANQVYEQLEFTTALMPIHESSDVLSIVHPDVAGVFIESSWSMELSAEGEMTHNVRRLVNI